MIRKLFASLVLICTATAAPAQFQLPRPPVIFPLHPQGDPTAPVQPNIGAGALQADLVVKAGSDTVYFPRRGYSLDANAIARLTAQARWLLVNPMVRVKLEGHSDERDTRDYALAIADRRANVVRDFLIMQGISPDRLTVLSWGKERPGTVRVGASLVSAGPRVVTVVQ